MHRYSMSMWGVAGGHVAIYPKTLEKMAISSRRHRSKTANLSATQPSHAPPFAQAPRSEELGVQVHAAVGNLDDEYVVAGGQADIDRQITRAFMLYPLAAT